MSLSERVSVISRVAQHDLVQRLRGEQATAATRASLATVIKKATGELPITINFMGLCKTGKSALQSAMIGSDLLPSASVPCTSIPTIYRHSSERNKCRIFHVHCENEVQERLTEKPDFEGTPTECRLHLDDLNNRARTLAARLEAERPGAGSSHDDVIIDAMGREGVPLFTVVEVYILGLVEANVTEAELAKCQFVDSPGAGEYLNSVVEMTIKNMTALSDLIVVVMDYKAMGTTSEAAQWESLRQQRPDILRELGDRCLYFLSFMDAGGAGAMPEEEALEHARQKVGECTGQLPSREQMMGGSGLTAGAARHLLRYHREGIVPSEEVLRGTIAPMVDADDHEDITFAEVSQEMSAEECQAMLDRGGLPMLERALARRLHHMEELSEQIGGADLAQIATSVSVEIEAAIVRLEKANERLRKDQAALKSAVARVTDFYQLEIKPLVTGRTADSLKAVSSTVQDSEAALMATVKGIVRVAEGEAKASFENEAAARASVRQRSAVALRVIRESSAPKASKLSAALSEQVDSTITNFRDVIVPLLQANFAESFKGLDAPELGPFRPLEVEARLERIRKDVANLGAIDEAEANAGMMKLGLVSKVRTHYLVSPGAVAGVVHQLCLANLASIKASFTNAAESLLGHIDRNVVAAIDAPFTSAKARAEAAVLAKEVAHDEQCGLMAILRQQCTLLSETAVQHCAVPESTVH